MSQRPRVMADTEGMELELRPRRSPFETGDSKASLATPSCCCCCCCLNTIGAASGMVAADLTYRARKGGRGKASTLFGLAGFALIPALAIGAVSLLLFAERQPRIIGGVRNYRIFANLWAFGVLLAFVSIIVFVLLHTALRFAAHRDSVSSADLLTSSGTGLFVAIGLFLEFFITTLTALISLLLTPISIWLGWRAGRRLSSGSEVDSPADSIS